MFSYADPARSWDEHDALLAIEESIVGGLGLPYRVVNIAAGDLGAAADEARAQVRPLVEQAAAAPAGERRRALVESGLAMPHWPAPYGRDAGAVEQLVVAEELERAGLTRPVLGIGAWPGPTILAHGSPEQH